MSRTHLFQGQFISRIKFISRINISRTFHIRDLVLFVLISRTGLIKETSYHGQFILKTILSRTKSYQGQVISRTGYFKDNIYRRPFKSRTIQTMDNSYQGQFVLRTKFISTTVHIKDS